MQLIAISTCILKLPGSFSGFSAIEKDCCLPLAGEHHDLTMALKSAGLVNGYGRKAWTSREWVGTPFDASERPGYAGNVVKKTSTFSGWATSHRPCRNSTLTCSRRSRSG